MFTDVLILAGGSGERLWPVSTKDHPKQFMSLENGISFLQAALLRSLALHIEGDILIVSRSDLTNLIIADCISLAASLSSKEAEILWKKIILIPEPCAKNTAPAIALGCLWIEKQQRSKEPSLLIMTSDHIIEPMENFVRDAETASLLATNNVLVSFAVMPTEAATGYGYIHLAKPIEYIEGNQAFQTDSFTEKPNKTIAEQYLKSGEYYWNSGMYGFRCDFFMKELQTYQSAVFTAFCENEEIPQISAKNGLRIISRWQKMESAYQMTPSISVDYAIAEKTQHSCTVKASFNWDDAGNWDSLSHLFSSHQGTVIEEQSKNCFVHSDIPVTLCGVEDIVVVIKDGQALVVKKGQGNLVKEALHTMHMQKVLKG